MKKINNKNKCLPAFNQIKFKINNLLIPNFKITTECPVLADNINRL